MSYSRVFQLIVLYILSTRQTDAFGISNPLSKRSSARFLTRNGNRENVYSHLTAHLSPSSASVVHHSTSTIAVPVVIGSAAPPLAGLSIASGASMTTNPLVNWILSTLSNDRGEERLDPSETAAAAVEGELLGVIAHIALDLFTLMGPTTVLVRSAALIGRLCAMAADYIPDRFMTSEELVFQCFMLTLTWIGLVQSAVPLLFSSVASKISIRDGKAFSKLFQPAGISWSQYKALTVCAFQWRTLEAYEVITSDEVQPYSQKEDEYIYWLYSGDAIVESSGKSIAVVSTNSSKVTVSKKSHNALAGRGLFGEIRLLRRMDMIPSIDSRTISSKMSLLKKLNLESEQFRASKKLKKSRVVPENIHSSYPRTTVKAGAAGAVVLRIHTPNLMMLMNSDPHFADSIRTLLLQGMQAKLIAHLESSIED